MRLPNLISDRPAIRPDRGATTILLLAVAFSVTVLTLTASSGENLLEKINREVAVIYQKTQPAVVKVHASRPYISTVRQTVQLQRVASGFFIDESGSVLTTSSVVDQGESFWIEWNQQKIPMTLVGADPHSRLALLKIDAERYPTASIKFPKLTWASGDDLLVGSLVITIGYLYDLPSAPSVGFVGGFDIRCGPNLFLVDHIRVNSKLSPGQQGGPLLNFKGEVVGVPVAAHLDDQCYAVPIKAVRRIAADLLARGRVNYGWLGLTVSEIQPPAEMAPSSGAATMDRVSPRVVVTQLVSDGPAAKAGIQEGDIVVQVHSKPIDSVADVLNTIFEFREGDPISLTVLRASLTNEFRLHLTARPSPPPIITRPSSPVIVKTNSTVTGRPVSATPVNAE